MLLLALFANWFGAFVFTWLYVGALWLLGWVAFARRRGLAVVFVLAPERAADWYLRAWTRWNGWAGMTAVIVRALPDAEQAEQNVRHELRHTKQFLVFGLSHLLLYGIFSLTILALAKLKLTARHPYYDNPFERDARNAAGQKLKVPREHWSRGPDDLFPWL